MAEQMLLSELPRLVLPLEHDDDDDDDDDESLMMMMMKGSIVTKNQTCSFPRTSFFTGYRYHHILRKMHYFLFTYYFYFILIMLST
jgi:hypothetical protein